MRYGDLAPSYRCTTRGNKTYVEIPARYKITISGIDPASEPARECVKKIEDLIRAHKKTMVFDENSDDHRATTPGVEIPLETWNRLMDAEVPGYEWVITQDEKNDADDKFQTTKDGKRP